MGNVNKAIAAACAKLEKRFGSPVVQKMSESASGISTTSSGRADLDAKMGGGWAIGKIHEVYAESGCGKTGLALEAVAEVQREGGIVGYIDMEHALNTEYCEQIGVNVDELYLSQPDYGEQAFEAIRALINTGEVDMIIVDSVAALTPLAELEGEVGETKIAMQARMMAKGMKLITAPASENECTVIFINQLRKTIAMYGPSETTTGGKALKFFATTRIEIKNRGQIKDGTGNDAEIIGFKQELKIVKNKIAPPFKVVKYDIIYGKGIDNLGDLITAVVFEEIVEKKGGGIYEYKGSRIARGIKDLRATLEDNPELVEELQAALAEKK